MLPCYLPEFDGDVNHWSALGDSSVLTISISAFPVSPSHPIAIFPCFQDTGRIGLRDFSDSFILS